MAKARSRKLWVLCGAALTALAVIFWSAYVFTAIWLRVRCARELADRAEPLNDVPLVENAIAQDELNSAVAAHLEVVGFSVFRDGAGSLGRLEALQRPSLGIVLRLLLGRAQGNDTADLELEQSVAWNQAVQFVTVSGTSITTAQLSDGETTAPQTGTLSVSVAASPSTVNAGQTLANIVLFDSVPTVRCYSVTDAAGEKLLVINRPVYREQSDQQTIETVSASEVILIDSAGRILERSHVSGRLLGKLAEPRGKADQLVFSEFGYVMRSTMKLDGPCVVSIIKDGRLTTVRTIDPPVPSAGQTEAGESQANE